MTGTQSDDEGIGSMRRIMCHRINNVLPHMMTDACGFARLVVRSFADHHHPIDHLGFVQIAEVYDCFIWVFWDRQMRAYVL